MSWNKGICRKQQKNYSTILICNAIVKNECFDEEESNNYDCKLNFEKICNKDKNHLLYFNKSVKKQNDKNNFTVVSQLSYKKNHSVNFNDQDTQSIFSVKNLCLPKLQSILNTKTTNVKKVTYL